MKKLLRVLMAVFPLVVLMSLLPVKVSAADGNNMYRLYNPNSGEHFYTANAGERDSLRRVGWNYEGIGWVAPKKGAPVYRLYNKNAGDHHYTANIAERNNLIRAGWKFEGVGWYSGGSVALYRQYNPNAKKGTHNYTTSKRESDSLVRAGWKYEGIGWYGVSAGKTIAVTRTIKDYADFMKLEGTRTYTSYLGNPDKKEANRQIYLGEDVYSGSTYEYKNVALADTGLKGHATLDVVNGYGGHKLRWIYSNASENTCRTIINNARSHGYSVSTDDIYSSYAVIFIGNGALDLNYSSSQKQIIINLRAE